MSPLHVPTFTADPIRCLLCGALVLDAERWLVEPCPAQPADVPPRASESPQDR